MLIISSVKDLEVISKFLKSRWYNVKGAIVTSKLCYSEFMLGYVEDCVKGLQVTSIQLYVEVMLKLYWSCVESCIKGVEVILKLCWKLY